MTDVYRPRDFQVDGAAFLAARTQAFLADEMGVGKSCQTVVACDRVGARNILVLVPANARVNWLREFEKFSPLDRPAVAIMDGKRRPADTPLVVCSYDLLQSKPLRDALLARRWDCIVLDECHMLKSRTARRTKHVYGHRCDGKSGLIAAAKRCWRLSGTPAPNNVSELWTHLRSAQLVAQNFYDFQRYYCTGYESDYGFNVTGTKNADQLRAVLQPFLLRRKKDQVMPNLPPLTFEHITIKPSKVDAQAFFIEQIDDFGSQERFVKELERRNASMAAAWKTATGLKGNWGNALGAMEAMAPGLSTLRRWIGLSKVRAYIEHVAPQLETGHIQKLVVFAVHKQVIGQLVDGLKRYRPVVLFGGTPGNKRQDRVDRFQNTDHVRVFIGQVQAAGTAITLTRAHRVDVLEASWVPADNAQAVMRCHRIGQEHPVHVRFFGCEGSVDRDIMRALKRKTEELAKVFD